MSNRLLLKRSNVVGKAPATTDINVGELAYNSADGVLYGNYTPGGSGAATIKKLTFNLSSDITGLLGYTPVNKAGDTISGALVVGGTVGAQTLLAMVGLAPATYGATQGAYISWNEGSPGYGGETDFINNCGSGPGGWTWSSISPGGTSLTRVATMDSGGNFAANTVTALTVITSPANNTDGFRVGAPAGAAAFNANVPASYTNWLLQLAVAGTTVAHIDQGGSGGVAGSWSVGAGLYVTGGSSFDVASFGSTTGAKLNLWGNQYGFGINGGELTAFIPAGSLFALRSGNGNSGTNVWDVDSNGNVIGSGNLSAVGVRASGPITTTYNAGGSIPPAGNVSITWNYTNGSAEVDFWNCFGGPGIAFRFLQRTGTSTPGATVLVDISPVGNLRAYGGIDGTVIGATTPASGAFTTGSYSGVCTGLTAAAGDNTTKFSTTAFVTAAIAAAPVPASLDGGTF